jgi:hypothetical protein
MLLIDRNADEQADCNYFRDIPNLSKKLGLLGLYHPRWLLVLPGDVSGRNC